MSHLLGAIVPPFEVSVKPGLAHFYKGQHFDSKERLPTPFNTTRKDSGPLLTRPLLTTLVKSTYQKLMTAFPLELGLGLQTSKGAGEPLSNKGMQATADSVRSLPAVRRA